MDRNDTDKLIISNFIKVKGVVNVFPLFDEDRQKILDIEQDTEDRSLMGLGKVINTGVRKVLSYNLVYLALTNMDFEWGNHPTLILKKGHDLVGEEIRDKDRIEILSNQKNVWFMHKNFVVYKDKISFPQDIMKKICHFEIPHLPLEWCRYIPQKNNVQYHSIIFANPATPCDIYLKKQYFRGIDERGLGTILIGIKKEP